MIGWFLSFIYLLLCSAIVCYVCVLLLRLDVSAPVSRFRVDVFREIKNPKYKPLLGYDSSFSTRQKCPKRTWRSLLPVRLQPIHPIPTAKTESKSAINCRLEQVLESDLLQQWQHKQHQHQQQNQQVNAQQIRQRLQQQMRQVLKSKLKDNQTFVEQRMLNKLLCSAKHRQRKLSQQLHELLIRQLLRGGPSATTCFKLRTPSDDPEKHSFNVECDSRSGRSAHASSSNESRLSIDSIEMKETQLKSDPKRPAICCEGNRVGKNFSRIQSTARRLGHEKFAHESNQGHGALDQDDENQIDQQRRATNSPVLRPEFVNMTELEYRHCENQELKQGKSYRRLKPMLPFLLRRFIVNLLHIQSEPMRSQTF